MGVCIPFPKLFLRQVNSMAGGRPTKYKKAYAKQAYMLCLLGATDIELANFFEVTKSTINEWKLNHPEFSDSLKRGKMQADAEVADKLYQRAKGYEHKEDVIFQYRGDPVIVKTTKHYPPDTGAAMAWLKNRQPKKWNKIGSELVGLKKRVDNGRLELDKAKLELLRTKNDMDEIETDDGFIEALKADAAEVWKDYGDEKGE